MLLDPYAICPGGTGKKIKFCCSDMLKELDEVVGLIQGGQPLAALERIRHEEAKHPDRACLLNYRLLLEQSLGEVDKAAATANHFMEEYPDNPLAMAHHAVLNVSQRGDTVGALHLLYRSIAASGNTWQLAQVEAGNMIGTRLIDTGFVVAGLELLRIVYAVLAEKQQGDQLLATCDSTINSTQRYSNVPLLFKDEFRLADPPDDALWKKGILECRGLVERGLILQAAESLTKLAESAGQWPEMMRALATVRLWLADNAGAAQALRAISRRPNLPTSGPEFEQAVDAEALLQLIDVALQDTVSRIAVTFPIRDYDKAYAEILSSPQIERYQGDISSVVGPDSPAPKLVCRCFDRPYAEKPSGDRLAVESFPASLGALLLFGKETDREARIELSTFDTDMRRTVEQFLQTLLGDNLGHPEAEHTLESVQLLAHLLRPSYRMDAALADADRVTLEQNQCRHALEQVWCNTPLKALDGKTPLQAAGDSALRIPLAAAVWLIELDGPAISSEIDVAALREKLGLAPRPTIDSASVDVRTLSIAKYLQLDVSQLSEEQLLYACAAASQFRFVPAIKRLATAILRRHADTSDAIKEHCYLQLAEAEQFDFKALEYVRLAQQTARAAGRSTVQADLMEMPLLFYRGQFEEFFQSLQKISAQHHNDPEINSQLGFMLMQLGVLRPDGTLALPATATSAAGQPATAAAPVEATSALWTPESAAATGGKKSALWVPD